MEYSNFYDGIVVKYYWINKRFKIQYIFNISSTLSVQEVLGECYINKHITASVLKGDLRATSTGVQLFLALASISALWVINSCATSVLLLNKSWWRGVLLPLFLASISAFWMINSYATFALLLYGAWWRGVRSSLSLASISVLWVINICATSALLLYEAHWKGVSLFLSLTWKSALWMIKSCATYLLLLNDARWRDCLIELLLRTYREPLSQRSHPTIPTSSVSTARSRS